MTQNVTQHLLIFHWCPYPVEEQEHGNDLCPSFGFGILITESVFYFMCCTVNSRNTHQDQRFPYSQRCFYTKISE